jgi:hypothetical protein
VPSTQHLIAPPITTTKWQMPRGCQKKTDAPPRRAFAKSQAHPIFFLKYVFGGVSRQGELKNTTETFLLFTKSPCRKPFPKKSTKISMSDVSFPSTFFVFLRFRVFLSDGSSKTLQKTFYKKIVISFLNQKFDKKVQNRFFSVLFSRFWAFLGERSLKTP